MSGTAAELKGLWKLKPRMEFGVGVKSIVEGDSLQVDDENNWKTSDFGEFGAA